MLSSLREGTDSGHLRHLLRRRRAQRLVVRFMQVRGWLLTSARHPKAKLFAMGNQVNGHGHGGFALTTTEHVSVTGRPRKRLSLVKETSTPFGQSSNLAACRRAGPVRRGGHTRANNIRCPARFRPTYRVRTWRVPTRARQRATPATCRAGPPCRPLPRCRRSWEPATRFQNTGPNDRQWPAP